MLTPLADPAGRRLLLDFGTSHFRTSLKWLLGKYEALGVQFDEIWAWEAAQMDPASYWAEVGSWVGGWVGGFWQLR